MPPRFRLILCCLFVFQLISHAQSTPAETPLNWSKRYEQAQDLLHDNQADAALALGKETVALAEKNFGPDNLETVLNSRRELIQLYLRCHRFPEAEKLLTEILDSCQRACGPNDTRLAQSLLDLGWFYSNISNYAKAEPLFQKALAIDEHSLGRHHQQTALVLNALGVLNENKGNYALSEKYFLEAIEIQNDLIGPDTLSTAATVNNLATLYWIQGDYQRAEKNLLQALAVREQIKGHGSLLTAATVNNLALVYLGMGDYERAETFFWRALRIREQRLGVDHPLTVTTVNHLGLLYYDLGDYAAAESFLQRAAHSREKTIGADQPDTARSIFDLAYLYDTMGQYAKAEPLHQRALDIRVRILGEKHPETAASYGFLARHYHLNGQLDKAAPLYKKALELQRETLGFYHDDLLKTLENDACLQLDRGDLKEAAKLAREASDIREHLLQNLFSFTSEKQRIDFQRTLNFYNLTASIGDPEEIARVIYRTKGAVLDSVLEDKLAVKSLNDPQTAQLIERLRQTTHELEQIPAAEKSESSAANRERLEHEVDALQAQVGERLGLAARRALQTDPAAIAAAVPEQSVIIEFIRYNACQKNLKFQPGYGALVQGRNQSPKWVELGSAETIETQVRLYQKYVRAHVRDAALSEVLHRLGKLIWQPLEPAFGNDCKQVILSPDADLNFISFATLLLPDDRFVCEHYSLGYVTSARDLLRKPRDISLKDGKLVVFAAPDFGISSAKDNVDGVRLSALPGTQKEAAFLEREAGNWGLDVESHYGSDASEAQIQKVESPVILHLATHGFYWGEAVKARIDPFPDRSRIQSTPVPMSSVASTTQRSLLALAGAQRTLDAWQRGEIPPADSDGILTAEEVSGLNLQGTWLVVLSACDTGLGQAQPGEGVMGLRRSFLLAGAQNLVMSLWPVGDLDTVTFMEAFYQTAIPSRNAVQALAEVQESLLVKTRQDKGLWQAVRSAGPFILSY